MKQANWFKLKEVNPNFFNVVIAPDFFDVSKTDFPQGIPCFSTLFYAEEAKENLEQCERFIQEAVASLLEQSQEQGVDPVESLSNYCQANIKDCFVREYGAADFEHEKMFYHPRFVHPHSDMAEEAFTHGIPLSFQNENIEDARELCVQLNQLLLEISKAHLKFIQA
ncbi:hypothetical protein [Serratia sp. Se-RSBMAAmG]|uniref:hypothetical protein n=1 Tax=Serratia sp. Se-RSBMAAmG TaxID=3043305 RepID=UPI0024AEC654|nr:hypothetical protein [Serratia sp. Se-RSBMAAmG]MDI6977163.1 hypothetical protein [Serratia sp. Se-RSBMAAmG]